jgi:phospholipid/cholesterol/gamma-HCH transport system ATP-binding protein
MIAIKGLKKRLGSKQVLDGVDLEIETGETMLVMGRSGGGKSVLLKHIIGLMSPDSGSIEVDGEEIVGLHERDLNEVRKKFGMLFQSAALFDSMTVGENIGLPLREHTRLTEAQIRERVAERLEWVGLTGVEDMKPASLSGGMRKRVGLARAIAMDPQFVLYDEPTTGLDPIMADVIDKLIRGLQKRLRVTSVVVTHDLVSANKVADRMALLHGGKVVFLGTPEEVRAARDPIVRQFVEGSSEGPIQTV